MSIRVIFLVKSEQHIRADHPHDDPLFYTLGLRWRAVRNYWQQPAKDLVESGSVRAASRAIQLHVTG